MPKKTSDEILAEKMLKDGASVEEVMKASGKSRAVIEAMKNDISHGRT